MQKSVESDRPGAGAAGLVHAQSVGEWLPTRMDELMPSCSARAALARLGGACRGSMLLFRTEA